MLNPKYIVNPKIKYNYSNINCIPEFFLAYSVVGDGELLLEWCELLLEWCEYFGQPQVWYISYVPQLAVVHQLCTTA